MWQHTQIHTHTLLPTSCCAISLTTDVRAELVDLDRRWQVISTEASMEIKLGQTYTNTHSTVTWVSNDEVNFIK